MRRGRRRRPGKVYNPLFIYGDTGLGKTHLMQAIAHELLERNPATRITYVGTEQFTNEFVAAIQSRTTLDFRRRYRETDLLLVDDVQFLSGKETTQEEFFHTFNAIYEAGRQICLTSDRPPKDIPGLEGRLVSRFEWGMVANVDLPEFEHRVAILRKKAQLDHLEITIPDEVLEFIAEHVKSSVRELEGSIIKLLAYASLKHRDITIELAREALRDKLRAEEVYTAGTRDAGRGRRGASATTCRRRRVRAARGALGDDHPADGGGRVGRHARGAAVEDAHEDADDAAPGGDVARAASCSALQLVEIGNAFGGRDHSTVIHSLERAVAMMRRGRRVPRRVWRRCAGCWKACAGRPGSPRRSTLGARAPGVVTRISRDGHVLHRGVHTVPTGEVDAGARVAAVLHDSTLSTAGAGFYIYKKGSSVEPWACGVLGRGGHVAVRAEDAQDAEDALDGNGSEVSWASSRSSPRTAPWRSRGDRGCVLRGCSGCVGYAGWDRILSILGILAILSTRTAPGGPSGVSP